MSRTGGFGAAQLFGVLRARFRDGWSTIPRDDRRRWIIAHAVGVAGMLARMAILVAIGKALVARGSLDWEPGFLLRLASDGPFSFSTAVWFQTFGTDITLWFLVLLTAGIAVWSGRPITALSIVLAYIVIDPVVRLGWLLWDRARPEILYDGVTAPAFHAFPSGHTGKTVAVYGMLIWTWMRSAAGWFEKLLALALLVFLATVVPLGRMTMGVHWPTDIIGGWLLGAIWLVYLIVALRFERWTTLH